MKNQSSLIDFLDSCQIYLDMLNSCSDAISYYSNITEEQNLKSISATLNFALENLRKEFSKYSNQGGGSDEK